ncbi:MAG: hypothetical protein OES13_04335 [Acidimicrobiia bacterium]|nr:hypothetical protein [Acidimicrobiia bacterium]
MDCSRCNAEAIVKRGNAAYCAKCALARDWEDVIAIVQEDRVDVGPAGEAEAPGEKPAAKAAAPAAVAVESNGSPDSDDLPADPFA